MNISKRAGVAAAVVALATVGLAGTAHAVAVPPGGGGCEAPTAHGTPGYTTFTLHVDRDDCGYAVKAEVGCTGPYGVPYMAYGSPVYSGGATSVAGCTGWAGAPWGYTWNNGSGWHDVILGR